MFVVEMGRSYCLLFSRYSRCLYMGLSVDHVGYASSAYPPPPKLHTWWPFTETTHSLWWFKHTRNVRDVAGARNSDKSPSFDNNLTNHISTLLSKYCISCFPPFSGLKYRGVHWSQWLLIRRVAGPKVNIFSFCTAVKFFSYVRGRCSEPCVHWKYLSCHM